MIIDGPYGEKIAMWKFSAVQITPEYVCQEGKPPARDVLLYTERGGDYWPFFSLPADEAQAFYDRALAALEEIGRRVLG